MVAYDDGTLDVIKAEGQPATITANLNGTANFATETLFDKAQLVNLTSLDQNTWYPVVSMNTIPYTGLHHIKCNIQLNSGTKPSWSTHSAGFTVNLDMLVTASGWGTTSARSIVLDNSYGFVTSGSSSPAGYSQMNNSSKAVFWVRGGGSYRIHSDWDANWQLQTSTYTDNSQSVSPTTSYPGVSINRSTITADIDGNATIATTGVTDYNDGNKTIRIGFAGDGLTTSNLNYIAGYTDNGTKIKDVNKDVLKSWLGNGVSASG